MKAPTLRIIALLFLFNIFHAKAQNIYTVAGNGTDGCTGNGGLATSAEIKEANGIVFDAAGNMYFSDGGCNVVRKVDIITGNISLVAGTGTTGYNGDGIAATSAQLNFPRGLAIDAAGNLYIADMGNNRIRKVNTLGSISTIAGTGTGGYNGDGILASTAQLNGPAFVTTDGNGNIYLTDQYNGRVRKIDAATNVINTIAGTGVSLFGTLNGDGSAATLSKLGEIDGIKVDAAGNVYFADEFQSVIRKINTSGIISTVAGNGTSGNTGNGGAATAAQLTRPCDIVIDLAGNLYINDRDANVVRKVAAGTGIISLFAGSNTSGYGGDNGPATSALLFGNESLGIDCAGNVYIGDNNNHRIRLVCTMQAPVITASATYVCPYTPVTFTVIDAAVPGCTAYYWFKTVSGSTTYVATGISYTDNNPINGEQVYCAVVPNAFNSICTTSNIPSNTITVNTGLQLVDVDINSLCAPGFSSPPVIPQFTTLVTGGLSVTMPTYTWTALSGNEMALSSTTAANPFVTGPTGDVGSRLIYNLTVSDGSLVTCPNQSRKIDITFSSLPAFDLAMRDSYWDMYKEPNDQGTFYNQGNIWESQDVWNRLVADGITENQAPEYVPSSPSNFMYAEVRNIGCRTSPSPASSSPASLKLYWTLAGLGENWSSDWTTATVTGVGSATLPKGLQVATLTVPALNPGQKTQMHSAWTPPDPAAYYTDATSMQACFLARIEDGHSSNPCGMTFTEVQAIGDNVTDNNNIVTRNSVVLRINHRYPKIHHIILGNAGAEALNCNVQFVNQSHFIDHAISTLSNYMYVKVALGPVFDRWVAAGAVGTYAGIDYENRTVTFDGSNTMELDGITFSAGEYDDVTVSFYMIDGVDGTQMPGEQIHFRQVYLDEAGTEHIYGNFSYTMAYDPDESGAKAGHTNTTVNNAANTIAMLADIRIYPNPAQQNLNVDFTLPAAGNVSFVVTDLLGREISHLTDNMDKGHQSRQIATGNLAPGMYILTVRTDAGARQFKFTKS